MTKLAPVHPKDTPAFEAAKAAQALAAYPEHSAWVEANAGSGKTKVLIDRVARLLLQRADGRPGAEPSSILCVTYTKAAANEMLSRLFERLGSWSVAEDGVLRGRLADLEGRLPGDYGEAELQQARALFARALETPGGLRIETIHAFCARVLRRFPLEAGVAPGFSEMEDAEADALWQAILADQIEAAVDTHPDALAAVSRAAGGFGAAAAFDALKRVRPALYAFAETLSPSEETLAARVRTALQAGPDDPEQVLAQAMGADFPMAAARGAVAALEAAIDPRPDKDKTNKALLAKLQAVLSQSDPRRKYEAYLGAIAGARHDWPAASNPYAGAKLKGSAVEDLYARDSRKGVPEGREITRMKAVQDAVRAAEAAERTAALLTIGLPILAAYQTEKARRALLDFDDLIVFTRRLLTTKAVTPWVLYKLDGGLSHILLDEAQDTSPPQWDLINALVEEFHAGAGSGADAGPRTQFVVGDPKQSIYSFQGADQSYFAEERQAFVARETAGGAPAALPDMTMSFRSCPQILGFVDEVAARVPLASAATDPLPPREADLQPHAPRRIGQAGLVELWPLCMPQKADGADRAWTAPVDHMPKDAPRRRLAKQIAKRVREMIAQGDTVWREQPDEPGRPWQREAMAPEDVLILVRRRGDLFEALIDSLKDEDLPVAGADRLKLLDNIGVQDCLNLIRFVLQPADDLTLAEILRGPFCNLTDDDNHLFPLAHGRAAGETLWSRLVAATGADFAPARAFLTDCLSLRDVGAFAFLSAILMRPIAGGATGLDRLVHRLGDPVRDPIEALVRRALSDDSAGPASLQAFLAGLEGDQSELKRDLGEPGGAIRVMTVHGAKGLQAPVVILPDTTSGTRKTDDQIFFADDGTPLYAVSAAQDNQIIAACRAQKNDAQERESRRLLYVAMTRAQDRLIICGAGTQSPAIGYASSSWYRWCLLAMQGLTGQAVDDETVEMPQAPLYHGALPPRSAARAAVAEAGETAPSWLFEAAPAMQAEGPQFVAPSALIADTAPVRRPLDPARAFGLRRGRLIHALLQVLPELSPDARGAHATRFLARASDLSDAERAEIHSVTFAALDHPEFAGVFGKGGRSEAAIAGALPDGRIVNGRVDRLVVGADEILVVDYKTDRPAPRHARDVGASYLAQMAAYRAVMRQIYSDGRPVRCALLYTDGPRLIELDMDLLSESLNRLNSEV